ncbi:glutathione ABC transporter ATP-binding protein [Ensifer sp. Root142]|nr:glutathione ABC transporter ATP-binding protein [Ensifer sp. Root142]
MAASGGGRMSMASKLSPLMEVENLSISFGSLETVKGVSFSVNAGEILGIVGESGSGKSLTCRALMGILPRTATTMGAVRLEGRSLLELGEPDWCSIRGRELGMIFQNPASHLDPLRRIGKQVAAPMVRHLGISKREGERRTIQLLEDVGIHDAHARSRSYPHEFSGGMKQRAMIAAAIGCGPKLLIADEPTTALDVTVQARILKLLRDLNRNRGLSIILISHDLAAIASTCSRVIVMRNGEIVEQGTTEEIINRPKSSYTQLLIASQPNGWSNTGDQAPASRSTPLISVDKLSVSFVPRGNLLTGSASKRIPFLALNEVDLQVSAGETVGIVGESGSGKSTLARAIVRQNKPSNGAISFDGSDVHELSGAELRRFQRRVQMVFQNPYDSLNPRMSVRDAVAEPIWRHGLSDRRSALIRADDLLEMVELPRALRERRPRQLSGGQCQRVGLARALSLEPELLIADEITSALDVTTQAQILELLGRLQRERQLALLYISHDLGVVNSICQRVYVFKGGRIVESGPTQQVLNKPQDSYTRELVGSVTHLKPHARQGMCHAPR